MKSSSSKRGFENSTSKLELKMHIETKVLASLLSGFKIEVSGVEDSKDLERG